MKFSLAAVLVLCAGAANAVVKPDALFSDNAVLQQGMAVPVWGTADAGEEVTVEFAGQKKSAKAGADGKWLLKLDALAASAEPRELKISGKDSSVTRTNVVVGEVWVGSGQSNMAGTSGGYSKNDEVLAKLMAGGPYPNVRLVQRAGSPWAVATSNTIASFSAIHFSFGLPLQRELNVPVGLMVGAVGGTPSGFWLSEEAYNADEACKKVAAEYAKNYNFEKAMADYEKAYAKWKTLDDEARAKDPKKGAPGMPVKPLKAGECRAKVGNLYEKHIRPFVGYGIRGVLWDQGESGTAIQGVDQYTLMGAFLRGWRKEWGQGDFAFLHVQKPSGEGPAWDYNDPVTAKANPFAELPKEVPNVSKYREAHIRIADYPNSYIVTASDLGSGIHPINKSGYGARAARVALGAVYGKPVEFYGPRFKSAEIKDGKAVIHFTHVGKGLAFKGGEKLQGFAVSADGKKFTWADAVIEGDTVVVSSASPFSVVRYACADQHRWANLFNKDGLPALPFHTDDIPLN